LLLLAGSGCGRGAHSASPAQRSETPDEFVKWCSSTPGVCRDLVPRLMNLSLPEHSVPSYNFAEMIAEILAGRSAMVSNEFARAIRTVLSNAPVTVRLERVAAVDRQLADYNKRDPAWRISAAEAQTQFASLTIAREVAMKEACDEARRGFRQLAERIASVTGTVPRAVGRGPAAQPAIEADAASRRL
jgi:hypothetical protein